jgi:uncharacterized coiled-coil DUF342 family protein
LDPTQELGELRTTLNDEVEQLRTEFQDLRSTLRTQLEATSNLAASVSAASGAPLFSVYHKRAILNSKGLMSPFVAASQTGEESPGRE